HAAHLPFPPRRSSDLEGSEVPYDICVTPAEAARSAHVQARACVASCEGEQFVPFPVTVNGHDRPRVRGAAPPLGRDTNDFLGGRSEEHTSELQSRENL